MKTVLVTGANGMLAANITEQLAAGGYTVYATLRAGRRYCGAESANIHIVEADFKDSAAMAPLLGRCDAVIHAAAMTSQSGRNMADYMAVNAEASERLAELAADNGVETFVYVSTANTIGYGGDESRDMVAPFTGSLYAQSKKAGETAVLKYCGKMRVVVVNPTFMIGKYGSSEGSNRVLRMVKRSRLIFCPSGGKNVIRVDEAARGIIMAMERGHNGQKYLICGENYSYEELFRTLARSAGVKGRCYIPIPDFVLTAAGYVGGLLAKLGVDTELTRANMQILKTDNFYHTDRASRDFGFRAAKDIV